MFAPWTRFALVLLSWQRYTDFPEVPGCTINCRAALPEPEYFHGF